VKFTRGHLRRIDESSENIESPLIKLVIRATLGLLLGTLLECLDVH